MDRSQIPPAVAERRFQVRTGLKTNSALKVVWNMLIVGNSLVALRYGCLSYHSIKVLSIDIIIIYCMVESLQNQIDTSLISFTLYRPTSISNMQVKGEARPNKMKSLKYSITFDWLPL